MISQNGQTCFKNLVAFYCKIFKVCLPILRYCALKEPKYLDVLKYLQDPTTQVFYITGLHKGI